MTRVAMFVVLISCTAFAQEGDFALPEFEAPDAGVIELTPPPIPVPEIQELPRVPTTPVWSPIGGSIGAIFTAFNEYNLSFDLTLLLTLVGKPQLSMEVAGEVQGWLLQAGVTSFIGGGGNVYCDGSLFCAARGGGGAAMKVGWARGMPNVVTGFTRPQRMYFAEVDVAFSYFHIESAPLAPGLQSPELLTRLRLGAHLTTGARNASSGVTFLVAAVLQAIPVSYKTSGVSFGVNLGLGF